MQLPNRIAPRVACALAATLILLFPALWNRFPVLEYDTGGYLARWFEGYLVPSRSTTYGLFLTTGWRLDFWPIVIVQALAAVWILALVLRIHRFDRSPLALPLTAAALALTTALAWMSSELLTDIFAGLAVLAAHLLVRYRDRLSRAECVALVLFLAFAVSTHSGTYAVLLALAVAALVLSFIDARLVPRGGLVPVTAAMALGALLLVGANFAVARSIAWTPGGYGLAFGRMLEDGIVTRYLDEHCPDPRLRLCPYRKELPKSADDFLWDDGVFNKLGRFAGLGDEMRTIVLASLRDYPVMQLKAAVLDTARQLVTVGTGYGVLNTIYHTYSIIERYTPSVAPAMLAARQQHGQLHFHAINRIDVPVALLSIVLIPLLTLYGLRNAEFAELGSLAATIALALLANAAFCSVISHAQPRYGSRLAWICVLTIGLAAWRAFTLARERTSPLSCESVSTA